MFGICESQDQDCPMCLTNSNLCICPGYGRAVEGLCRILLENKSRTCTWSDQVPEMIFEPNILNTVCRLAMLLTKNELGLSFYLTDWAAENFAVATDSMKVSRHTSSPHQRKTLQHLFIFSGKSYAHSGLFGWPRAPYSGEHKQTWGGKSRCSHIWQLGEQVIILLQQPKTCAPSLTDSSTCQDKFELLSELTVRAFKLRPQLSRPLWRSSCPISHVQVIGSRY